MLGRTFLRLLGGRCDIAPLGLGPRGGRTIGEGRRAIGDRFIAGREYLDLSALTDTNVPAVYFLPDRWRGPGIKFV
jgi:hypothetical protein